MYIDPLARILGGWAYKLSFSGIMFRIVLSFVLATVVGWERANKRHAAGLRTFVTVSMASTAAMITDCCIASNSAGHLYLFSTAVIIAAAMISVNSILYSSRNSIKGLTTSAALWACSIIGLSAGGGYYTVTLASFVMLIVCVVGMPPLESFLKNRSNHFEVHLELKSSQYLQEFVTTGRKLGLKIDDIELNPAYSNSGLSVYTVAVSVVSRELKQYKTHREIIEALGTLDYVYHIEEIYGV